MKPMFVLVYLAVALSAQAAMPTQLIATFDGEPGSLGLDLPLDTWVGDIAQRGGYQEIGGVLGYADGAGSAYSKTFSPVNLSGNAALTLKYAWYDTPEMLRVALIDTKGAVTHVDIQPYAFTGFRHYYADQSQFEDTEGFDWSSVNQFAFTGDGESDRIHVSIDSLTVVPEPRAYAGATCLVLVAFAVARWARARAV